MPFYDRSRRRFFLIIAILGGVLLFWNVSFLSTSHGSSDVSTVPIVQPPPPKPAPDPVKEPPSVDLPDPEPEELIDTHPIGQLMQGADLWWKAYEQGISETFQETVTKYREKYGRHPPPGFVQWYQFARERNVHNIDDFGQIMDDLRPFWAVQPSVLRNLAAHMAENEAHHTSVIHVRDKKIANISRPGWRSEMMQSMVAKFVEHLPDMDIAMNSLDQPRVIVPWDDMQNLLKTEAETRMMPPEAIDGFTERQDNLTDLNYIEHPEDDTRPREDAGWFDRPGQQLMEEASRACPPESPARNLKKYKDKGDSLYKTDGGIITNFNASSDLCIVGPVLQDIHGLLFSSSSMTISNKLVPIFSECKVNVNSDMLFPANMYFKVDDRYDYDPGLDLDWEDKKEIMLWRGVTSGGVNVEEHWFRLHRQRLVRLVNATVMEGETVKVLKQKSKSAKQQSSRALFQNYDKFKPSSFAEEHTDVGFTEAASCIPDKCPFYDNIFEWKPNVPMVEQFKFKYLVDVDGHSFSGRWRAFLQSRSLGLKATIFREWHDSRLFAWRHFVPMDNRYDDLYSLLTYFIGYGTPPGSSRPKDKTNPDVYIASHDAEARRIATQGREWANKVLRLEDIEVYMFRLMLEYARIVDDNRDRIGYSGTGSELDKFDTGAAADTERLRWGIGKISELGSKIVGGGKKGDPPPTPQGSRLSGGVPGLEPKPQR